MLIEETILNKKVLNNCRAIFIAGNCGSGKTALAFSIIEQIDRPIYFLRYPRPSLLKEFGYGNLLSLDELEYLQDVVIVWDEPQTYLATSEYKKNQIISKVLSLARQRNITMIILSSDTRAFIKGTEAFFDTWIVKDIEFSMTKQRSMIRKVIQENSFISAEDFHLPVNEFLFYNRKLKELNGRHTYNLPIGWSEVLSSPYRITADSIDYTKQSLQKEMKKVQVQLNN